MKSNKFSQHYSDYVQEGQATSYAGNFFYAHLADVWNEQLIAISTLNDATNEIEVRLKALQNLYDMLLLQKDLIFNLVEQKHEREKVENLITKIKSVTRDQDLLLIYEEDQTKLIPIKQYSFKLRGILWALQYKYGLIMPNKPKTDYGVAFS